MLARCADSSHRTNVVSSAAHDPTGHEQPGKGVQRLRRDVRELIIAPRRQHSQKPEEANDGIERLWPAPYLEIFARNRRPG